MTSKLTRERLQEIAEDGFLKHGESKELARMALAAMDGEPVAEVVSIYGDPEAFGEREIRPLVGIQQMPYGTKLYRHAQPVPVVSADLLHTAASAIEDLLEHTDPNTSYYSGVWADVPGKLRAAMFQAKSLTGNSPVIGIDLASGPDRTVEVHYVAPPGYVMVPKEPTAEMISSGIAAHYDRSQIQIHDRSAPGPMECAYVAMLAAAPQSPGSEPATVPGKWIPVSERMPIEFEAVIAFDGDQVYGEAMYSSDDGFTIDGYEPCDRLNLQNVTHWMPLPAGPKEVKGE